MAVIEDPVEDIERELQVVMDKTDDMTEEMRTGLIAIDKRFGYGGERSGSPVACPCR